MPGQRDAMTVTAGTLRTPPGRNRAPPAPGRATALIQTHDSDSETAAATAAAAGAARPAGSPVSEFKCKASKPQAAVRVTVRRSESWNSELIPCHWQTKQGSILSESVTE